MTGPGIMTNLIGYIADDKNEPIGKAICDIKENELVTIGFDPISGHLFSDKIDFAFYNEKVDRIRASSAPVNRR